jgi:hypothetical protein
VRKPRDWDVDTHYTARQIKETNWLGRLQPAAGRRKGILIHQFCNQQHSNMMAKRLGISTDALKDHFTIKP